MVLHALAWELVRRRRERAVRGVVERIKSFPQLTGPFPCEFVHSLCLVSEDCGALQTMYAFFQTLPGGP
eukprot:5665061-Pyramimonas_sp.AAC.1